MPKNASGQFISALNGEALAAAWAAGDLRGVRAHYGPPALERCVQQAPSVQVLVERGTEQGVAHHLAAELERQGAVMLVTATWQERQAELSQKFSENALDATDAFAYFAQADELDGVPEDVKQATRAARQMFALHGLPKPVGMVLGWLKGGGMRDAAQRTLAQALAGIANPTLRQLLAARGGDYGLPPAEAPLMLHATVMGSYTHGAWYPVGGPQRFAESLGATVREHGFQQAAAFVLTNHQVGALYFDRASAALKQAGFQKAKPR